MELAMSKVISLTRARLEAGILSSCAIMGSTLVPEKIATILPFLPLAFLLVIMVYSSPLERAVSSIESFELIFWGKMSHSLECGF